MTTSQRPARATHARVGLFVFSVAIAIAVYAARPTQLPITGDEPHYVIMADALVHDRTLDLRDAYAREARTGAIYRAPLNTHVAIVNHRWAPYHAPGLAILLAVPFLAGGVAGAKIALCLVAGLLPVSLVGWFGRRMPHATAVWLTVGVTIALPLCFGASQVYPDLVAGVATIALALWLIDRAPRSRQGAAWLLFWIGAGALPWLNVKFLPTTIVLAAGGVVTAMHAERAERAEKRGSAGSAASALFVARRVIVGSGLVAIGPASLAAFHLWGVGSPLGPRGGAELTTSFSRAAMMFLGLHLDQSQGMFLQHPLMLAGIAASPAFARMRPRAAVLWLALYASLIVPNSLELARFGGGGPVGRFAWSALWLWAIPIGFVVGDYHDAIARWVKPAVIASLVYQALLAVRWLPDLGVLFPRLEEQLSARDSLFPVGARYALPSFYFWDFSGYWTYLPNVVAYLVVGGLVAVGAWLSCLGRPAAPWYHEGLLQARRPE